MADVSFNRYSASQRLKQLAQKPIDLSRSENLTPERLSQYCLHAGSYKLLYATERIDNEVLRSLFDLAQEAKAIEKMGAMQSGEVINCIEGFPSEERSVLHTATRDFFASPNQGKNALEAAALAKREIDKLKKFMQKIDEANRWTDCIMIGIGGSDLGPRAHYMALLPFKKPGRSVHFISNVDPDDVALNLKQINLKNTLVIVVSKSGTTLETKVNEEFVRSYFIKAGLKPEHHFIAVTGEGSPMDDRSRYLESFHIWDWIGGRYSTTSMVGGVMLSFAYGFDCFWEILKGANQMDKIALSDDSEGNLPLLGALLGIWNRDFLGYPTLAIIPYSQALIRWAAHIQQLDMESNGKHIDKLGNRISFETGPIIWGEPGTNAQHSFFQLIHQGTTVVPIEFIGFKHCQFGEDFDFEGTTSQEKLLSNLFAQSLALATGQANSNPNKSFEGNRPSHILLAEQLTPLTLGALLSYFENKVAFQGFIWNINSFDQEGVQLGKVLANKIIHRFASRKRGEGGEAYPQADALLHHLW